MYHKTFSDNAGNEYDIEPLTQGHVLRTVRELKKKGIVITSADDEFEKGLAFQLALAGNCLVALRMKDATDGSLRDVGVAKREAYLGETPGATAFISAKAAKMAEEAAKLFEDESGN